MDFTIDTTNGSTGEMTLEPARDIRNNVFLSLVIIRGSWWLNPGFGMRDTRRLKNTAKNARLVEGWVREALQWLLDTGRAKSIEVAIERDPLQDPHRLKAAVTVVQANGTQVTFEQFIKVV